MVGGGLPCSLYCAWTSTATKTFCSNVKFCCCFVFGLIVCTIPRPTNQPRHSVPMPSFGLAFFCCGFAVCTVHRPTHQPRHSFPMPSFGLAFCLFGCFGFAVCTVHRHTHQPRLSVPKPSWFFALQSVLYMDLYIKQDVLTQCKFFDFPFPQSLYDSALYMDQGVLF